MACMMFGSTSSLFVLLEEISKVRAIGHECGWYLLPIGHFYVAMATLVLFIVHTDFGNYIGASLSE